MQRIIGSTYHGITRVIDMLCLGLFSQIDTSVYSLHVQTQWRFLHNHKILLASRDIYIPFSNTVGEGWDYSIVGRAKGESSIFDAKCENFDKIMRESIVSSFSVSEYGDLQIVFSNGVIFELFIPASEKDEEWRLVDLTNKEHIVFFDV